MMIKLKLIFSIIFLAFLPCSFLFAQTPGNKGYIYTNPSFRKRLKKLEPLLKRKKIRTRLETPVPSIRIERKIPSYEIEEISRKLLKNQVENKILKEKLDTLRLYLCVATRRMKEFKYRNIHYLPLSGMYAKTYVVNKGDSLWKIAGKEEIYNDSYKWLLLYHANRDQIYDPDIIFPGMVLIVPYLAEVEVKSELKK